MKAVLQRVTRASVTVEGRVIGRIDHGLVVLLGVAKGDGEADVQQVAEKITRLRIFSDDAGKMNRAIGEVGGAVLLVSQFTLVGNTAKGRRPSFDDAAPPDLARALYAAVGAALQAAGLSVAWGEFGAHMAVELINDGPVTFLVDSRRAPEAATSS